MTSKTTNPFAAARLVARLAALSKIPFAQQATVPQSDSTLVLGP